MSDLETLKREHPSCSEPGCGRPMVWTQDFPADEDRYWKCPATPEQHRIASLETKLQQHEAELAKAQETIAERDGTIKEKDARIAELEQEVTKAWNLVQTTNQLNAREHSLGEKFHSEQQAHAATREELRRQAEVIASIWAGAEQAEDAGNSLDARRVLNMLRPLIELPTNSHSARAESEAKKEE